MLENIEGAFQESGMAAVCHRHGVAWVNLSREPAETRSFPDNRVLREIAFPRVLRESLLITLPVMKTHAKTVITGALKNQWGCLPTMRHEYHLVLDDALADLNAAMRPALAVMDATVGLEGNGPKSGRPRITDRILCSRDPVALDTIQAISMGFDPAAIAHLGTCAARGIGTNDRGRIEVRGLAPEAQPVPYRPARHNAVSVVETLLRRSTLKRLFFNTPVRQKFLRSQQTEMGHSAEAFTRVALGHPHIHFRLSHGGRTVHDLPPAPDPDFNGDDVVDAADYAVWRKRDGSVGDYELWWANFGVGAIPPAPGQRP